LGEIAIKQQQRRAQKEKQQQNNPNAEQDELTNRFLKLKN
jgi:hypothetical protein